MISTIFTPGSDRRIDSAAAMPPPSGIARPAGTSRAVWPARHGPPRRPVAASAQTSIPAASRSCRNERRISAWSSAINDPRGRGGGVIIERQTWPTFAASTCPLRCLNAGGTVPRQRPGWERQACARSRQYAPAPRWPRSPAAQRSRRSTGPARATRVLPTHGSSAAAARAPADRLPPARLPLAEVPRTRATSVRGMAASPEQTPVSASGSRFRSIVFSR